MKKHESESLRPVVRRLEEVAGKKMKIIIEAVHEMTAEEDNLYNLKPRLGGVFVLPKLLKVAKSGMIRWLL